jgi:YD repeat-containing protein
MTDQTRYTFDAQNRPASVRDRNGIVTQYLYDSAGRLEKIVNPVGLETVFAYANGQGAAVPRQPGGGVRGPVEPLRPRQPVDLGEQSADRLRGDAAGQRDVPAGAGQFVSGPINYNVQVRASVTGKLGEV